MRPNANFPSAVAWVGSSLNVRSVKQVKKNFAELVRKTLVSVSFVQLFEVGLFEKVEFSKST